MTQWYNLKQRLLTMIVLTSSFESVKSQSREYMHACKCQFKAQSQSQWLDAVVLRSKLLPVGSRAGLLCLEWSRVLGGAMGRCTFITNVNNAGSVAGWTRKCLTGVFRALELWMPLFTDNAVFDIVRNAYVPLPPSFWTFGRFFSRQTGRHFALL